MHVFWYIGSLYLKWILLYYCIGIGTLTWSPLAGGVLTGKYDDGVPIYSRAALKVLNFVQSSSYQVPAL